jgi:hypothetical protein
MSDFFYEIFSENNLENSEIIYRGFILNPLPDLNPGYFRVFFLDFF